MKKSRHSEEQIIGVLKQVEAGRKVAELAREVGVSEAALYTWKSKYGGMEVSEARRLRALEEENRRLQQLVADLSLDREALKVVIRKNGWSLWPEARRGAGDGPGAALAHGGGPLHARMPGDGSGQLLVEPARNAGAGVGDGAGRRAGDD